MTLLEAALQYARAGYRVHPCRIDNKRPLTKWGRQATTDPTWICSWWQRWPDALIGLCTGNGLVVVDIDPRHGGEQDVEACAETLTVTTPGGGWHHYYRTDQPIGCAIGLLPGVDIRGEGGYVIAPPSPGYAWDRQHEVDLAPLPDAIVTAMQQRSTARSRHGFDMAENGSVGEGYRHDYMVRFAGWYIHAFEPDGVELSQVCWEEYQRACSPADAPRRNIDRIAWSILAKHERAS